MISFKIKKQVVLIYLWLWWITSTNICVMQFFYFLCLLHLRCFSFPFQS
ncbi:hypothetical protein MtrunA17_Chr8g0358021 [Medicago truncatula]|uniref:Transmembrane protein n=1 Tax=Medicago truncatula TaxID=3880 RepID=A0A396GME1_MEDTR|nr:hypothetical protein MtrunA17_Chr8g0358021 [Medicago truncatula]